MSRVKKIATEKQYDAVMQRIDVLMKKGDDHLTNEEAKELRALALEAQAFEQSIYEIPAPQTLEGIIELKMYEKKLKQKDLAKLIGMGEAKVSQILNKKRPPDVDFLKAVHQKLGIDGNWLLLHAKYVLPVLSGLIAAFFIL
jgi:HTH-type transcriptional regulator/antitoxin HigA